MTERELFMAALDREDPAGRAAYLDQACGGDAALRQRVEALLRSHLSGGDFLDVPAAEQVAGEAGAALPFLAPSRKVGSLGRLGHYEVLEAVGRGGTGVVVRALDEKLQRVVAIKALAPLLAMSSAARQRFVREARATATITHDNVIAIHAVEETGPVPYLVMQFIDGPTLQQKLDRDGMLPVKEILRIGVQIAEGLAAAHKQGLVHRDVKPANILLENGVERVKLTDFGLARAGDDASMTQSGVVAGTPMYMSPEQAEGAAVDSRSDLFSLGSVMYAMCTGRPPFRAPTAVGVLRRVSEEVPRPVPEINPEIPDDLCSVIARLQAKDPADRYPTAAEVADVLRQLLARRRPPDAVPRPAPGRPANGRRRFPLYASAGVVGFLFLLLAVGRLAGYLNFGARAVGPAPVEATRLDPIRVGVLHSQTGTMGSSESAAVDATLLAVEEINQSGGLLGRPVEPVVADGMSDWPTHAREAERLITAERACAIFGCWTSASRKAVAAVVARHDHLLVYPMQHEGLEQSPHVVYTGAVPNQQVTPAVRWCFENLGKRFFIVGSDYVWPRATGEVIRDHVAAWGGTVVGEAYLPLESVAVENVVEEIQKAAPDVILEMVAGDSKVAYYRALRQAGVTPDKVPSMSFSSPQPGLVARDLAGDYASWSYFDGIDSPANRAFVTRFRAKFGAHRVLSDPLAASYVGVHLWAQAVRAAGSVDPAAVRRALRDQRFQAPEGEVRVDPETQHLWKTPRVARLNGKGTADIVWSALEPVRPVPFPASRSREQWQRYLADLHDAWGGQWSAPAPTWERTVAGRGPRDQVRAVVERLRRLNPGFDRTDLPHKIEGNVVTEIELGPRVADISPLRALTGLKSFRCFQAFEPALADLSPLKDLKLTSVYIAHTLVTDLGPLRDMKLTSVHVTNSPVSDLTPLRGMKLTFLALEGTPVTDLSPVKDAPLTALSLESSPVADLSPLTGIKTLTTLNLWMTRAHDLTPLTGLPLTTLNVGRTGVKDLTPLRDMKLTKLICRDSPISDLSPLQDVPLTFLDCHHTNVADLAPLTGVPLTVLDFHRTNVADLAPLKAMKLSELNCSDTKVTDLAPLTGMPLRRLTVDFQAERDTAVLRSLKSLERINGRKAEEFWKD
jgi:urea transport system substrate-binding protein